VNELVDHGYGVYELLHEKDPMIEHEEEDEDATETYENGVKRFDEPSATLEEPTKEINLRRR